MPEINLDNLDAALIADVEQQYRDGLITRKDADRQIAYIQGGGSDEKPRALFSKSMAAKRERT